MIDLFSTPIVIHQHALEYPLGYILEPARNGYNIFKLFISFLPNINSYSIFNSSITIKNRAIRGGIAYVRQQVSDGKSLSGSISSTKFFPNLVIRMFKVGEESGNMESALINIKYFYDKEINDSIERLVGLIQPTITVVMGGMIAWIAIAVFGPIYSTFTNIQ